VKITERDIEIMGWVLEQKFMTRDQIRRVFWKDVSGKCMEDYRRLCLLKNEGYLKVSRRGFYKQVLYLVTEKGVKELKRHLRDKGLSGLADADYSNYRHDREVTEIRILLHEWGQKDWIAERILTKRGGLRRVPDGMVFSKDKFVAIEYEASRKSKQRYKEIFYSYELDEKVHEVLYVVDSPDLVRILAKEARTCSKMHFVTMAGLKSNRLNARVENTTGKIALYELLEAV